MAKFGFNTAEYRSAASSPQLQLVDEDTLTDHPELGDTLLDYALRYADIGWYVIPVRADKKPLPGYGLSSATRDPAVVRNIWTQHPEANIAVACERSGLVVLDVDPRNGGAESLAALEATHGVIHSAVTARTQGGGEHRVFRASAGARYPGTLGPGLDLKHHGYVLVAPSKGPSGRYAWLPGRDPTSGTLPTEAPALLRAAAEAGGGPSDYAVTHAPGSIVVAPEVYADLERALAAVPPELPYDEGWFRVLQGLSRLADSTRAHAIAKQWSLRSGRPGHTAEAFESKWRGCLREAYSVSHLSVFHLADRHAPGWRSSVAGSGGVPVVHRPGDRADYVLQPITIEELRDARLNPRVVLPYMLYADVRTRISAGGTGKTTVALYEAITLALGRELWGRQPERAMRTAVVTREDTREVLVARAREVMRALELTPAEVAQVLANLIVVDLSYVGFRVSRVVDDVVEPHSEALGWLVELLRGFRPDWLVMDPLVSFGVGEQRVNDAEQGLIEAMRILRNEFDCCVEGIHHSGKANAREKALDQYAGRGGSALADGARMVCVMQPLEPDEWFKATGDWLQDGDTGIVMALPKLSYCRQQEPIYVRRRGYAFTQVMPVAAPSTAEREAEDDATVYLALKEAWLKNEPLSLQDMKNDYKTIFYGNLKRDAVLEAVGRLKRDGRVLQHASAGGRGSRSVLEPVIISAESTAVSRFAVPYDPVAKPGEPGETRP